ncbi:hypothetical protein EGR_00194 [Echinococcus granulosus]|uniref:Uncharacterized protein n=1 Tax=Echinococcus granulosus TaxID=6210 RepID=W6UTF0_ECHGR|nr:hypothetical protein EGR_00194 [Echinococcus granulosus]EUB64925.1 hypothetical protein EGR_00194 [Echinococcus granulosus]
MEENRSSNDFFLSFAIPEMAGGESFRSLNHCGRIEKFLVFGGYVKKIMKYLCTSWSIGRNFTTSSFPCLSDLDNITEIIFQSFPITLVND